MFLADLHQHSSVVAIIIVMTIIIVISFMLARQALEKRELAVARWLASPRVGVPA